MPEQSIFVWQGGGQGEDELLAACYRNSLNLAREHGLESIAFPAISTGIFGFPADRAARIALETIRAQGQGLAVTLVAFDAASARILSEELDE
ncbi:macro domain-containing protein [Paracoccus aestuariivivens]|uniref:Macro domain-containing protein n=1 Tax=Paracoccus aestuariivivens TaxID=1820333 RepID=A0A6L6JDD8_9RHOB|nr:macro domain-containing protein [Paracoccus aestuariivivens]MTH79536.1 hypothetical protein [Paracoccus aestuariivivens]